MSASPCPFCGCDLLAVMAAGGRSVSGYGHPVPASAEVERCFMAGHFVGAALVGRWNARAAALGMEVVDGHPVFNHTGKGRPVEIGMVNATVIYYRRQADEAQK